ncbi:DUF3027 domain-containing protein [Gulosibacter chungangensis]|uniref:DUF3027 domain-containing protein n=1 Tax=Gulosibacter chungangensis TaxID=979746 RepID=A0A7J5BAS1_9MICO|nr:DUF3027 domain-containing protein [Gulosibacter chungangensis]KAB1643124.1 DUF3027 domain-containing protein [Gulosibacter chungangensis]
MPESTPSSEPVAEVEPDSAARESSAVESSSVQGSAVEESAAENGAVEEGTAEDLPVKRAPDLSAEELATAIEIGKTALYEITEFNFVGDFHEAVAEDDEIFSLRFVSHSPGFRDWWWTVTMTQVAGAEAPTVLECGLLPGEDALLAPEWVPWAKRLARFRATHDSHGNPLPEADAATEEEAPAAPRMRTRKRTRTRLRRRGESNNTAADSGTEAEASTDGTASSDAAAEAGASEAVQAGEALHASEAVHASEAARTNEAEAAADRATESSATLPVAADIRDYAEEMDEVLDGVTFEDDDDTATEADAADSAS